jgi:hypothetical protein
MLAAINAGSGRNSATESKFPAAVLTRSFDYGAEMHILIEGPLLASDAICNRARMQVRRY